MSLEIRALTEPWEFREAVRLQKEIWGFAEVDVLPVRLFIVGRKIGGQSFGAFDGERMVGFCVSLPAIDHHDGSLYLHSNMLGVEAEYRNSGAGRQLKLAQRDDALARGIRMMEWTFDPFQVKNAYFNMERLGAVVRRYALNMYGVTTSALHGGLPTDRCICEWHMASARVEAILAGHPLPRPAVEERIAVPANFGEILAADPARARALQQDVSERFSRLLDQGLAVLGFERAGDAGVYLLSKWQS